MKKNTIKIVILGAGISGLSIAYWLKRAGFDITVLESKNEPGGSMETRHEEGFLVDYGPNSGLETVPLIGQLVDETGLREEMIYANNKSDKRYILRNDKLYELPTSPGAFFKTKLFSFRAKARLLAEPFIGRSRDGYYQSISEFVTRRLGREFLDYAINPFVAGVFAGDPDSLSVKSAFPKLYRLEERYGGLILGMIRGARERKQRSEQSKQSAKMFSFKNGMQAFPNAIAEKIGDKIKYGCDVQKVVKDRSKYKVVYRHVNETCEVSTDIVLCAIPAYRAASIFAEQDRELFNHLSEIYYPSVKVLYLGFKKEKIGRALDGFGFLIPETENKTFLGAIWSSVIFPQRAGEDKAAFTLFIGGARSPELLSRESDELVRRVIGEFKNIMNIHDDPIFVREKTWPKAIPQYTLGYIEHERYFEKFEIMNQGLFLAGNYRGGISVGDCIKNSETTYKKITAYAERMDG